jgi:predicted O-methyltransferase YrrM
MLNPYEFEGIQYRVANNWYSNVNLDEYKNKPINYLEIGCFYGANVLSVAHSYGLHEDSKLYCIDPWTDYDDYNEYITQQPHIYNTFLKNIEPIKDKVIIKRGFSHIETPKLEDNFFDIIYVDANHEPDYVFEDAVLSFRKLKKNGVMIFDDYAFGGQDYTQIGIDSFLNIYKKRIEYIGELDTQYFIKKI